MSEVRNKKKQGSKKNDFGPDEFMAVKKVARNICKTNRKLLHVTAEKAASLAVAEIHRRLPGFKRAWEMYKGMSWEDRGGDVWFAGRINHHSRNEDNKASHMRIKEFCEYASRGNSVHSWEEWVMLVNEAKQEVIQEQFLYLLPFSYTENRENGFEIQKVGIAVDLATRLVEHSSRGERGTLFNGVGLWPAKKYVLTCPLGRIPVHAARMIERECMAAIGDGKRAEYGYEWFKTDVLNALSSVKAVCINHKLKVEVNSDYDR
jgi:hypothetical protein